MFSGREELQEKIKELRKVLNTLERKKKKTELDEDVLKTTAQELEDTEKELIDLTFPHN